MPAKHEDDSVTPARRQKSKAQVPRNRDKTLKHPSGLKPKLLSQAKGICKHGARRTRCRKCWEKGTGGSALCKHGFQTYQCRKCWEKGTGGSAFCALCKHGVRRIRCRKCWEKGTGGSALCNHGVQTSHCRKCWEKGTGGSSLCKHGAQPYQCRKCSKMKIALKKTKKKRAAWPGLGQAKAKRRWRPSQGRRSGPLGTPWGPGTLQGDPGNHWWTVVPWPAAHGHGHGPRPWP